MKPKKKFIALVLLIFAISVFGLGTSMVYADDIPRGGVLRATMPGQPPTLDPLMTTTVVSAEISRHIFETLLAFDANMQPVPVLAESYEVSEDGTLYTFYLRQGILFHNGKEMVAEDVIASMTRWLGKSTSAKNIIRAATFSEVDKYTVEMRVEKASTLIPQALAVVVQFPAIMPKEIIDAAGPLGVEEYIGTGPYKFLEWKQDQHVRLVRYEEYKAVDMPPSGYAGKKNAYLDEIRFEAVKDPYTQLAGIQTGLYDEASIPPDSYEWVKAEGTLKFADRLQYEMAMVILLNKKEGWLANNLVRQAILTAVDNDELLYATAVRNYRTEPSYMMRDVTAWYSDAGKESYDLNDPAKAKQLLAQAGYKGEELILITSRDYEMVYNGTVVLQQQLEKAGIKTRIDVFDWPTLIDRVYNHPDKWDIYYIANPIALTPLDILYFTDGFFTGPLDEKSKDLLSKVRNASTIEEAKGYWDEMQEYSLTEFVPYIKVGETASDLRVTTQEVYGILRFLGGSAYWNAYKKP